MLDRVYWEKEVVTPIKNSISGVWDLRGSNYFKIESILDLYCDEEAQLFLLDALDSELKNYYLGNNSNPWLSGIMQRLMGYDAHHGKVVLFLDLVDIAFSWASKNEHVRTDVFIKILSVFDASSPATDWAKLEQRVNGELRKLKVYGDKTKCGYLALLHAYIRIKRDYGDNNLDKQSELLKLLSRHWDFIRLVYSVMIRRIVDNGNRDFAAIANNMRVLKSHHKYVHIFYAALKERMDDLSDTKEGRLKIDRHLKELLKIQKETPQDYDLLDNLCTTLFPNELQFFLDRNNIKSYDEVMDELQEMKAKVDSLNYQITQMAQNMANAVKAAIPLKEIEKELLRLSPGTSFDVFTQLNALLIGNRAWLENASMIKDKVIGLKDNPATQNNFNIELVQKKETNIDKNYGPNIENNGTLSLPNKDDK